MPRKPSQTINDLWRKAIVTDDEIAEAVEAYFAEPSPKAFRFASGYIIDLVAAVDAHGPAKAAVAKKNTLDAFRRTMVRTALMAAVPVEK